MPDFRDPAYLQDGNPRQQEVFSLLQRHRLLELLSAHDPVLTGTFPIGIDLPGSDLDIACCWTSKVALEEDCRRHFSAQTEFRVSHRQKRGHDTLLVRFQLEGFPVEVFGQGRPVSEQESYRHMCIEHRLLEAGGEAFRREVIRLKEEGLSTEAAFCQLMGLEGDPYLALLDYGT